MRDDGAFDDLDLLDTLAERTQVRLSTTPFAKLPRVERVVYAVDGLLREINNGGFDEYFGNASGDYARTALEGLERLGAERTAELLRHAMDAFGPEGPPPDRDARKARLGEIRARARADWEQLEGRFFVLEEDVVAMLAGYARRRLGH